MQRQDKLREFLVSEQLDGVLIFNASNVFYYSNFKGTNGALLITKENSYLITDFRYVSQAKNQAVGFEIIETNDSDTLDVVVNQLRKTHKLYKLGLEGDYISRNQWLDYERKLTSRLIDVNIDFIRKVKLPDEIEKIKKAIEIAETAFNETLNQLRVGQSEKEVARFLEFKMLELGAQAISFNTIVASGHRGALPHGVASDKLIAKDELITFDFGCVYEGYCSDITRTVGIGKIDQKLLDIYQIVLDANLLGLKHIAANMPAKAVDTIVRDYISSCGYGDNFGHGLGHSLGIDVHENPRLNQISEETLKAGYVMTVEPGIYVEGLGGVRIEDDVLLHNDKIEILTTLSKELIILQEEAKWF